MNEHTGTKKLRKRRKYIHQCIDVMIKTHKVHKVHIDSINITFFNTVEIPN